MADRGAFGRPERVDAAHVAQEAFAEVVQVVPFDAVALGVAGRVAPAPADRDGGVEEVRDLVVRDLVVGRAADPHAHGAREEQSAVADDVVVHAMMAGVVLRLRLVVERADLHAARAEVRDEAFLYGDFAGAASEREPVAADVRELAADEGDLRGVFQGDDPVDRPDRGLVRYGGRERGHALGMAEGESAEGEMTHLVAGLAGEGQQFLRDRDDAADAGEVFACAGLISQPAGTAEEPLARFVEEREQVLDDDARMVIERGVGLLRRPADLEDAGGRIRRLDAAPGGVPFVVEGHDGVLRVGGADFGEGVEFLRFQAEGLLGHAGGRCAAGDRRLALDAPQEAGAGIARAGAGGSAAADPELFEALGAGRQLERPASVRPGFEDGQFPAAGNHRHGARGGFVGDAAAGFAGIAFVERDRLGDAVGSGGEDDPHRFGQRTGELTDRLAGAFERRQRGVGASGGAVIAQRRDVDFQGLDRERQQKGEQQERAARHAYPTRWRPSGSLKPSSRRRSGSRRRTP